MYQHSARKPHGSIILTDPDLPHPVVADTLQCVHCDCHWQVIPGSGAIRGWCQKCMGPFCGPDCAECIPFEKKLDLYEKGRLAILK